MKTKIVLLLLIMSSVVALAQNVKPLEGYSITPPKFTGVQYAVPGNMEQNNSAIVTYLKENVMFPEKAGKMLIQGTVVIGFVVTPQGELSEIKVINSVFPILDDEVVRVLRTTSGMWEPGRINGETVAREQEISLSFAITDMSKMDFTYLGKKYFSRATTLLFVKNEPAKALRNFDKGIVLLPNDHGLLLLRGMTRFELGDKEGALKDWTRIKTLGGLESDVYIKMCSAMKGYEQMSQVLQK